MKIAVDGYELHKSFTGVGRYLANLLNALVKVDRENRYILYLREPPGQQIGDLNLSTKIISFGGSHTRWQNTVFIRALKKENPDLLFSPDHSIPLLYRGPAMMTIHDPSWKTQRKDYSFKERLVRDYKTRISVRKVCRIFTVSRFTRQETLRHYSPSPEKVVAIHSGVEGHFHPAGRQEEDIFRRKYNLIGSRVIGFLGSMFNRRHIGPILEAFSGIRGGGVKLFLVGRNQFHPDNSILNQPGVIWRERIPEKELNAFYSSLDLFLYISDYEGFGFPPMEALMCKTPSLLLKGSSLEEIYNGMAFFVDRPDPPVIRRKIEDILASPSTMPDLFTRRWEEKRRYFRWERAAKEYLGYFP